MSCRSIMDPNPATLPRDATIAAAIKILLKENLSAIPVIDKKGGYVGMIRIKGLLDLMLPRAAALDDLIVDLSFMTDTLAECQARLKEAGEKSLRSSMETEGARLHPDMPVMEVLLTLSRNPGPLPVVDPETDHLVGMVSPLQAIRTIAGQ